MLAASSDFDQLSFVVDELLHVFESEQDDVAFVGLHDVGGMEVSEEEAAAVQELNCSEDVFEDLFWRERDLCERVFVAFEGQEVVGHRVVDLVPFVDANLLCLHHVLPQSLVQ